MSEALFERYLRNELDEAGQRELSAILATEEGSRAFAQFVQEWTLLGEAALQRVAETGRPATRRIRKSAPAPSRAWIGWAAGLAAAAIFMAVLLTPTRHPPPAPPTRDVAQTPPAPPAPPPAIPEPERPPAPPPEPVPPPPPPPVKPTPEPLPTPEPQPAVPVPKPPEPPRPVDPTKVARPVIAVVSRVEGDVQVVSAAGKRKAVAGEKLSPDEGLEGTATIEFPDGTRIELASETTVDRVVEKAGKKIVSLSRGALTANVTKQPAGRAVGVATPHADISVLGTQFTLAVTAEATKLEVREGRVRMTRLPDGASVEVAAGFGSVAAKGQRLESKPVVHTRDFQDGARYVGTRDTHLSGADPARAFGSEETLEADGDEVEGKKIYALLKWDLSDLPAGAVIKSAVITFNILNESQGRGYSVFEMKRDWSEFDATWTHAAPNQPWRAPGLKSTVDRGTEVLATVAPRMKGTLSVLLTPAAEAVIQGWVRNPATNHGFLIANDTVSDGFKFSSREAFPHNLRPKLTLTYTLAGK